MGKSRRKHSREFKVEAVRQVVEHGRSVSEVAVGLGIHPSLLTRWKTELAAEGAQAFRGNGVVSAAVAAIDPASFERRLGSWRVIDHALGAAAHDLYHAGQINLVKRLREG